MVLYFYSAIKNTQGQGNKVMNDNHTDWKWLGIERKGKGKFSSLYLKFHYLWWILMPTSYIYNLPRFPQGNGAEIGISIKVYRQFILSLQGITWCSFPSREEQYQQLQWLSGGDREADAHTTLLTLTMLSQSWAHTEVIWVPHPCPFPLARPQKMVRASTLSISRVQSALGLL